MPIPMQEFSGPATVRKTPRPETASETIHCILEGAKAAWLAQQHAPPAAAEVARCSNLSRSTIQRHFPTANAIRDALFSRYIARRSAEYRGMLETLPEDANAQEVCATTVMAILRAGSAQPLGPVQRYLLAEFFAYARRHGRPLVRVMAEELAGFLQRRGLAPPGVAMAELSLATGMAMRETIEHMILEQPALLAEASTAEKLAEWLHQSLFTPAPTGVAQ